MGFLEDRDLSDVPTILEYYKGKTIFITGGSGFVGKVLIEKLLYSCTELDRIYLLMRSKKGVKSEDRLAKIYSSVCFDRLRMHKPGVFESKVFTINGDVMEDGLGLSEEDRKLLVDRVNIIFHVAASVRFDDPLAISVKMNLSGTVEIVNLAKEIRNLSVLVHVSTSYCNMNRKPTEEIMYPPHADWRDTLHVCNNIDHHTLRVLTPKYLGELPNTYTFTKQLAEHVVYEQRGQLPAVIVRPSVVISSLKEPVPGWVDSFNGPIGMFAAAGKGIMRIFYGNEDAVLDLMPVDICVKNIIATAWIRGTKKLEATDDVPIYNCCSNDKIYVPIQEVRSYAIELVKRVPIGNIIWNYGDMITTSFVLYYIGVLLLHLLPSLFIDTVLWGIGKKPMLTRIQRRIYIANIVLQPFVSQQWTFDNANFVSLSDRIKKPDRGEFAYGFEDFDFKEFFAEAILGTRRYLLNEKDEDIPKAKAHNTRMWFLDVTLKLMLCGYLLWRLLKLLY